jgi:carboxyl-terminal processing protease
MFDPRYVGRAACFAFVFLSICGFAGACRTRGEAETVSSSHREARAKLPDPPVTPEQRQKNVESFDIVWTTVKDKHFDPTLNGLDWNAVRDELRPRVEAADTMPEAREVMEDMLARLGQTHLGIIPAAVYRQIEETKPADVNGDPDADSSSAPSTTQPSTQPAPEKKDGTAGISVRVVDGKPIVTRVEQGSTGAAAGVKPGWELLQVRGKPVTPLLAAIGESVKSPSLRPGMSAMTLESALRAPVGKTVDATFRDGRGRKVKLKLPMAGESGSVAKFGHLPPIYVRHECRRVEPNIMYFHVSIFLDPSGVMPALRKCVEQAAGSEGTARADGFIIDLRGNPGGIGFMAVGMGNLFVDKPDQRLGEMTGRGGSEIKFVLDPQPLHYGGPLAVLVDECSMSTSEILAGGLRDIGRARVFGVRTAGAALPSTIEILPNGDRFQYVVANYTSSGGQVLEGQGVQPDEPVTPDRKALLAGNDPILDAAVRWIQSQKRH